MYSLGNESGNSPRRPGRWTAVGPIVLAVVFLVALVMAANGNDVLGWVIAVIAFGWLVLATVVYIGVHKAARFGADQVRQAQSSLARATGKTGAGTRLLDDGAGGVRDLKIDHSFKIIQVQARVIEEALGAENAPAGSPAAETGPASAGRAAVERALETILITAHNGRGMVRPEQDSGSPRASTAGPDDDGPVTGVVID